MNNLLNSDEMLNLGLYSKETIQKFGKSTQKSAPTVLKNIMKLGRSDSILRTDRIFNYKQNEPLSSSLLPQTILGPNQNIAMSKDNKFILIIVNNFQ